MARLEKRTMISKMLTVEDERILLCLVADIRRRFSILLGEKGTFARKENVSYKDFAKVQSLQQNGQGKFVVSAANRHAICHH
jgi:hypothetical protein